MLKTRTFSKSESLSNKGTLLDQYSRLVVIAPKGVANSQNILDGGLAQSCTTFQVPPPCPLLLILGRSSMHLVFFVFMGPRCPNIKYGGEGGSTSTGLDKWCRILLLHCLQVSESEKNNKHSPPNCTQPPPLNVKASTSICKRRGSPHHTQHQSRILENKQLHTPWILENKQLHTPCQLHV